MKVKDIIPLLKLFKLAIQVSTRTTHDVFVQWYGHTKSLEIEYHKDGWATNKIKTYLLSIYVDKKRHDYEEDIKQAEATLKMLLKEGKVA